ncbi:MAG TPA: MFS transporter [Rhodocyclaceae bacterium]|nr:MFS transporter [Rhodocyclaceae bacterium]
MNPTAAEKHHVLLLAGAQALFQTASVMIMTLSGLVGLQLAADKSWATLPIALMTVAAAATMIPASIAMQRFGRKAGFLLGAAFGCLAGLIAAWAIWRGDFWLFVCANMLMGCYQAFAQYYRFAAADIASVDFKSRAISWVIAGGIVAALAGPNIARLTQGIGPIPFMTPYLALFALSVLALLLLSRLSVPPIVAAIVQDSARPLFDIMKQPVFLTALTGSSVGYAVMVMVMTATPLAMQSCGQPLGASTTVIQWHVLGMFAPSFFTGNLIRRYGVLPIMGIGVALLSGHVAVALSGIEFLHFLSGLILLGVGWNFLFVGGTTLLTEAYRPSERAKTQAAHDFLMFGAVSLASFSAGGLLNAWGWDSVNWTALPFLAFALLAVSGLALHRRGAISAAN